MREDGASEGDHQASAQRQIAQLRGWKRKPKASPGGPPFPEELDYVWEMFLEHAHGLSAPGMGAPVVTWESLAAWREVGGPALEYWEALTLIRLGLLRASIEAERQDKESRQQKVTTSQ